MVVVGQKWSRFVGQFFIGFNGDCPAPLGEDIAHDEESRARDDRDAITVLHSRPGWR